MKGSHTSSGLSPDGLTDEQLLRFAEHGFLVLEGVFDDARCRAHVDAIDGTMARLRPTDPPDAGETEQVRGFKEPHRYDPFFFGWFKTPGLMEANRQLIGNRDIVVRYSTVFVTEPHPHRTTRRAELMDPDTWGWHRDFHPQWMIHPHATDDRLIHSTAVVNATFYTPVSAEDGVTAFLDGSHRYAGEYADAGDPYPLIQPTIGAGGMVLFTEAMLHAAVPVLSERTRIASFTWMAAPWFGGDDDTIPYGVDRFADEELRSLFQPAVFGDAR